MATNHSLTPYQRVIIVSALRLFEAQLKGHNEVTADDVCFRFLHRHPHPSTVGRLVQKINTHHTAP